MSRRAVVVVKALVHLACAAPLMSLLWMYGSGGIVAQDDPVQYVTHFTGHWALWLLLSDLAITPVRRLSPKLSWMIRLRRMVGLWAFFYATLHLLTYVLLFSGYDVPTAMAGLRAGHPGAPWTQLKLIWPAMLEDVETRRFLWAGLATWTILLALAVTSPQRMLRAMGGKNWQRLHWLIYVAGWMALTHVWWQMKKGEATPWKVTAVFFALLLARVVYAMWKRWTRPKTSAQARA